MTIRISLKLTILCLSLVVFTSGTLFYFASYEANESLQREINSELTASSYHSMGNVNRFFYHCLVEVYHLTGDPYLRSHADDTAMVQRRLEEFSKAYTKYYSFSYFDMNRIRIADSKGLSIGKRHSYSKYWQKALENPQDDWVMDISKSESVGKVVMHFARFVRVDNGKKMGLLVARVLIDELYQVLLNESIATGNTLLSDME